MVKIKNKKVKKGFELIKYTRVQKKNIHLSLLTQKRQRRRIVYCFIQLSLKLR